MDGNIDNIKIKRDTYLMERSKEGLTVGLKFTVKSKLKQFTV